MNHPETEETSKTRTPMTDDVHKNKYLPFYQLIMENDADFSASDSGLDISTPITRTDIRESPSDSARMLSVLQKMFSDLHSKIDNSQAEIKAEINLRIECPQAELSRNLRQQIDSLISKAVSDLKSKIDENSEQIAQTKQTLEKWRISFESDHKALSSRADTVESKISVLETDLTNEISNNQLNF